MSVHHQRVASRCGGANTQLLSNVAVYFGLATRLQSLSVTVQVASVPPFSREHTGCRAVEGVPWYTSPGHQSDSSTSGSTSVLSTFSECESEHSCSWPPPLTNASVITIPALAISHDIEIGSRMSLS